MKRVRYVCDHCGATHYEWVPDVRRAADVIQCLDCRTENAMRKQFPRVANHFHPTKGE